MNHKIIMLTERIVIQKSTFGKNPFIEFLQWAKLVHGGDIKSGCIWVRAGIDWEKAGGNFLQK